MSTPRSASLLPPNRLEAFSDGVFAIAITLLVLELRVPEAADNLFSELGGQWPSYLGYFVSFAFIGGVWTSHATLSRFTQSVDQVLMGLNLVLLLLVSFLPFTTSLLATHLGDSGEHVAVVIFGVNLTLASGMVNVIFGHVARTPGLAVEGADEQLRAFDRQRRVVVFVQGAATVLGLVLPGVAVVIYLMVSLLLLATPIWRVHRAKRQTQR